MARTRAQAKLEEEEQRKRRPRKTPPPPPPKSKRRTPAPKKTAKKKGGTKKAPAATTARRRRASGGRAYTRPRKGAAEGRASPPLTRARARAVGGRVVPPPSPLQPPPPPPPPPRLLEELSEMSLRPPPVHPPVHRGPAVVLRPGMAGVDSTVGDFDPNYNSTPDRQREEWPEELYCTAPLGPQGISLRDSDAPAVLTPALSPRQPQVPPPIRPVHFQGFDTTSTFEPPESPPPSY